MPYKIQLRRGTAAQWTAANPILADGEMGIESDTRKVKIGNGSTAWNALPYNLLGDVADNAVTEAKIANNAVTTNKIINNAVTQAKLAATLSGVTICTSSTRPGSPFNGQFIYETDTDITRVWDGAVWDVVGTGVFTSTTRPASPYEGKLIYETDTDLLQVYNGTAWTPVGAAQYAAASGGTTSSITAGGVNYKLHTFTTSGTLTINTAGFVDIMAIGAGGGGHGTVFAPTTGGGGGGGEIYLEIRRYMNAGTYAVAIGAGVTAGLGGRTYMNDNAFGFGVLAAQGGGPGGYTGGGSSYGGAGGGGGSYGGAYGGGTTLIGRGISRDGGQAAGGDGGSGGGGGAGGNGGNASGFTGGSGGPGADISAFLGQSAGTTIRAGGGGGGTRGGTNGTPGTGTGANNTGGGGNGSPGGSSPGWSGIFYVRSAP